MHAFLLIVVMLHLLNRQGLDLSLDSWIVFITSGILLYGGSSLYWVFRPSDSVRKILGDYAQLPGGHIMRQKRFIMQQIMRFLCRRFHTEHILSLDSQQH